VNAQGWSSSVVVTLAISRTAAALTCPAIPVIRSESDPATLHAEKCDLPSPLSYVDLGDTARHVSFGGEVRQRYEYTRNPGLGADPHDAQSVWLQRYALHSDLQWGSHARAFVELQSVLEQGRSGGPSPLDEDKLELQNAFLEGRMSLGGGGDLRARAGRQELELGSARLISVRDGPNVRRTFDGLRLIAKTGEWTVNALALKPRRDRSGVFDDSTRNSQRLWGVYATRAPDETRALGLDAYYLVREDDEAAYDQGVGRERRETLGVRLFGTYGGWRWDIEQMFQFGRFASGNLRAWTLSNVVGYTWSELQWQPGVRISASIASGDRNRDDPDLQTFHPLYPRGNYFSQAAILGPQNFYHAHVFLTLQPSAITTLTVDYDTFWRQSTQDGVYGPSGRLLRSGESNGERLVARDLSLTAEWKLNRQFNFLAIYSRFSPGPFLKQAGLRDTLELVSLTARYRF
jgi:hypothetical protein